MLGDAVWSGYQSLVKVKDRIILIPRSCETAKIVDLEMNGKELRCTGGYYTGMVVDDKAWLFPYNTNRKFVCISLDEDIVCLTKEVHFDNDNGGWIDVRKVPNDDNAIWITTSLGELWKVDDELNIIENYEMKLSDDEEGKIFEKKLKNGIGFSQVTTEGVGFASLKNFIKALAYENEGKNEGN